MVTVPTSLRFMRGWLRTLADSGYEVHTVCSPGSQVRALLEGQGVARAHTVPMNRSVSPVSDLIALLRLLRLFRTERYAAVHASTPKGGLLGMLAALLARVPVRIYTLHGLRLTGTQGRAYWLLWCTEWLAMHAATHRLAVSDSVATAAEEAGVCAVGSVHVIRHGSSNGIDSVHYFRTGTSREAPIRRELGLSEDDLVVGFVGRLVPDKGIAELMAAWKEVAAAMPRARLLIVGDVEEHDTLPANVLRALVAPGIVRVGWQEETRPYYEAMDVLTLPTHREGFGNVLLEAGAMEIPVVATKVTGCIDAVVDDVTGYLVPLGDVAGLASALLRLANDADSRKRLALAGRHRAVTQFQPHDIWEGLLSVYGDALRSTTSAA